MSRQSLISEIEEDEIEEQLLTLRRCSPSEILNDNSEDDENTSPKFFESIEEHLEFERDFVATARRLIDHHISEYEAEKQSIIDMREYYSDCGNPTIIIDPKIDAWLKEQENKYQIGSCYMSDECFDEPDETEYDHDDYDFDYFD